MARRLSGSWSTVIMAILLGELVKVTTVKAFRRWTIPSFFMVFRGSALTPQQTNRPIIRTEVGRRTFMRKLWKTLIFLVVIAGASAAVYAISRNSKKGNEGPKLVDVTTGSIVEKAVAVGQIQPRQKFSVKSKISGIVRRSMIEVGDTVKAGDPLFEIAADPTPLEATGVDRQVESARASFQRAQVEYQRSIQLSQSGVLPKSDLDMKKEAYDLARVALTKAQQDRDLTRKGRLTE